MLGKFCCFDLEKMPIRRWLKVFTYSFTWVGFLDGEMEEINNSVRCAVTLFGAELILSQTAVKLNRELKEKPHRSTHLIIGISDA